MPASINPVQFAADSDVALLTTLFREGSRIAEPNELLRHFGGWFGVKRESELFMSVSKRNLPEGKYKVTRWLTMDDRVKLRLKGDAANPWRDWDQLETHEGGLIGSIIEAGVPALVGDLETTGETIFRQFEGKIRSLMAIPTYDDGEPLNWATWLYADPKPPAEDYFLEVLMQTSLLGLSTKNLVNKKRAEELNTQLQGQFEKIATIQRSLLPQRTPKIPTLDIATSYITSDDAGGDYYDFFPFPDGRWGILIADVAGHGPAAATVMAMLRAILHCFKDDDPCPGTVMEFTNEKLVESRLEGSFVTAFFALFNPQDGEFVWARCGHNPPRLRRADGTVVGLSGASALPLGIADELTVEPETITLDPGDTVVLYTDGITETMDASRELFGEERMDAAIHSCTGMPECIIDSIYQSLYAFSGHMNRDDDQTIVAIRRETDDAQPVTIKPT